MAKININKYDTAVIICLRCLSTVYLYLNLIKIEDLYIHLQLGNYLELQMHLNR